MAEAKGAGEKQVIVVAIASHKGGVGKTTTTAQLGTGLAVASSNLGAVVLIDADAQGHLGEYLGIGSAGDFATALLGEKAIVDCLTPVPDYERLWVMRGDLSTWRVEQMFAERGKEKDMVPLAERLSAMLQLLSKLGGDKGRVLVLIDTGPGFSEIQTSVLFVADYILCPLTPSVGGQIGMNAIWGWFQELHENNKGFGILPQMYDLGNSEDTRILRTTQLQPGIGQHFFPVIPYSREMAQALDIGTTVWQSRELSKGMVGARYSQVLERLAGELGLQLRFKRRK